MEKAIIILFSAVVAYATAPEALCLPSTPTAAGPTYNDGLGSIISSFRMSGSGGWHASGIYRDANYVYGILAPPLPPPPPPILRRFTPTGTLISSYFLAGNYPSGGDQCHLGPGYFCFPDDSYTVFFVTTTGSAVSSFGYVFGQRARDIAWTGPPYNYYIIGDFSASHPFYLYTTSGSLAGTWTANWWPSSVTRRSAWTIADRVNNVAGCYFISSSDFQSEPTCVGQFPSGTLIATWSLPIDGANGACYGPGYPSTYGGTYWINVPAGGGHYAMQFDLGNNTSNVLQPASFGKLRALFYR